MSFRTSAGCRTFTAFVFLNADDVPADAGREHPGFASSFTVFAPTECWGVEDHCDWSRGLVSPFDRRLPHHLTPINVSTTVTDTVRRLGNLDALVATVHAVRLADREANEGVFRFGRLTALAYQ